MGSGLGMQIRKSKKRVEVGVIESKLRTPYMLLQGYMSLCCSEGFALLSLTSAWAWTNFEHF